MATTTMRLGLLLIFALAIIQISTGESEKEDESQMEQKSEGNMMASSMEEVELRTVREAGKKRNGKPKKKNCKGKKGCARKGRSNTSSKKRCLKKNKKNCKRKGRKNKSSKKKKKKGGKRRTRKNKTKKKGKKNKQGNKDEDDLKKKKRKFKQKGKKNEKKNPVGIVVRQTCDEQALCQKIKDYIKYSNQLRKVKRIVKSCDTMEKKANKSTTEFDATVAALDEVIASNAKRRLYIRWRRTQRSTDEVVAIRDNLKNCSVSVKTKCEKKVEPACLETALHTECEASLQAWLNSFGPSKGSCLQANADCCACITALPTVDAKCLDFDTKSTNAVASKKKCTGGTETGSFGFCRKQQQDASVKGPPAACGGSTATKAPSSATTAAAGGTTAAPAGACNPPPGERAYQNETCVLSGAPLTGSCITPEQYNACEPVYKFKVNWDQGACMNGSLYAENYCSTYKWKCSQTDDAACKSAAESQTGQAIYRAACFPGPTGTFTYLPRHIEIPGLCGNVTATCGEPKCECTCLGFY